MGVTARGHPWTVGLLAAAVVATVITLSTRNDWDQAPICASTSTGANGSCVTDKLGSLTNVGNENCSGGPYYSCTDLPVDIGFADGSRRHLTFSSNRLHGFLAGGPRDPRVIPGWRDQSANASVIGRFHGLHLVGLRFPATGAAIATDDYPGSGLHAAAEVGLFGFPILALFAFLVRAYRAQKRRRPTVRGSSQITN